MNTLSLLYHVILVLLIRSVAGMGEAPIVCISSPILTAKAGSVIEATIDGPPGIRCEATLRFSDPNFLPVYFGFQSLICLGSLQVARFTIPSAVPNGDAFLLWQCTGQGSRTCNHLWISDGDENLDLLSFDQTGTIACLVPTATLTTLTTVVGSSTTLVEAIVSTDFEEIVPTATSTEILTITEPSTTITETVVSVYISTVSPSVGGTASAGRASIGTASAGTASTGTASAGAASTETASPGTASAGTASMGTASAGAASTETASPGTASAGTASTGTASAGAASTETASPGTASAGTASMGTASAGAASTETASPGTVSAGTASTGTASAGSAIIPTTKMASAEAISTEETSTGTVSITITAMGATVTNPLTRLSSTVLCGDPTCV